MNFCRHQWGFPRRHKTFGELRNVDVQRCTKCGHARVSPVQFGNEARALQTSAKNLTEEVNA